MSMSLKRKTSLKIGCHLLLSFLFCFESNILLREKYRQTSKYRGFELKLSEDDAYAVLTSRTTFSLALGFVRGFAEESNRNNRISIQECYFATVLSWH